MSVELKEAAQQALKELGEARKIIRASSSRQLAKDWDRRATDALANLRTAIQQPATGDPVLVQHRKPVEGWSGETIGYTAWRDGKGLDWWPHRELYDHPAPSVPGDSKRLDYLQDRGATIDLIAGVAAFYPMRFRVGGLHSSANIDVRAAIDAAMLAAK